MNCVSQVHQYTFHIILKWNICTFNKAVEGVEIEKKMRANWAALKIKYMYTNGLQSVTIHRM